jgi:hypothetical protein
VFETTMPSAAYFLYPIGKTTITSLPPKWHGRCKTSLRKASGCWLSPREEKQRPHPAPRDAVVTDSRLRIRAHQSNGKRQKET